MAFRNKHLSVIAYANGWTMWNYKDPESNLESILGDSNFFDPVSSLMSQGDIIYVIANDGVSQLFVAFIENRRCFTKVLSEAKYEE